MSSSYTNKCKDNYQYIEEVNMSDANEYVKYCVCIYAINEAAQCAE